MTVRAGPSALRHAGTRGRPIRWVGVKTARREIIVVSLAILLVAAAFVVPKLGLGIVHGR